MIYFSSRQSKSGIEQVVVVIVTIHLRKVGRQKLGHGEGAHPFGAEDLGHLLVGDEELLVFGVLEVVLLEVSPQLLHTLGSEIDEIEL